jgi:hypothetical protein
MSKSGAKVCRDSASGMYSHTIRPKIQKSLYGIIFYLAFKE